MMKKIILISCVCLTVAVGIYFKFRSSKPTLPSNSIWVQTAKVEESSVPDEARSLGTLSAKSISITPEIAGHVQRILFTDGALVKAGEPLLQLEDAVYKTRYQLAKAKLDYSLVNLNRMRLLGKQGAISKQAIDQAEADYKEKKADAKEAEVLVKQMLLKAPFDGVLGKSSVAPGEYVTVGQSIVPLTDVKHLRIEYSLSEKYHGLVKLGQKVKVTTSAYPNKTFTGTVSFISPTINTDNRSISLYADLQNDENLLAAGMFVNVKQRLDLKAKLLLIPARSLIPILDGAQVFKVIDGKAYAVSVITGLRKKEWVQIIQGLSVGDDVITDGQFKVKNGTPVQQKTITQTITPLKT